MSKEPACVSCRAGGCGTSSERPGGATGVATQPLDGVAGTAFSAGVEVSGTGSGGGSRVTDVSAGRLLVFCLFNAVGDNAVAELAGAGLCGAVDDVWVFGVA